MKDSDPKGVEWEILRSKGVSVGRQRPAIFRTEDRHLVWMHPSQCQIRSLASDSCGVVFCGKIMSIEEGPANAIVELESAMNGTTTIFDRLEKLGFKVTYSEGEDEEGQDGADNDTRGAD